MTNFAISWSRLESAETCPLQCYYKNFAPKHLRFPFDDSSPHLVRGRKVHIQMENALRTSADRLPKELDRFKPMVQALRNAKGKKYIEHQLALTAKYQGCDWFSPNAYWRTIYDFINVAPLSHSIDWKTGKIKDKATDQLKFSSAAAFLNWPEIEEIKNCYVWLDYPDAPPTTLHYTRKDLKDIMDEFEERVEVVKIMYETNSWEPTPSDYICKWCPATKEKCPHARN